MHCIDAAGLRKRRATARRRPGKPLVSLFAVAATVAATAVGLAGCSGGAPPPPRGAVVPSPAARDAAPGLPPPGTATAPAATAAPPPAAREAGAATAAPAPAPRVVRLAAPATPRDFAELRLQAAHRLVAAHPDATYERAPVQPLMAIPVLRVELNGDGSVRRVVVVRAPRTAPHTVQLAVDAVHRAAPYGEVWRLPQPWEFVETFLFEYDGRFMPRSLDR